MANAVSVLPDKLHGSAPVKIQQRRPTLDERERIIMIEDRFGKPGGMDELLTDWHHEQDLPLDQIAGICEEPAPFIRYLMWCYEIEDGASVTIREDSDVDEDKCPFSGSGAGVVAPRVIELYNQTRSWPRTAMLLRRWYPGSTLEKLREWAKKHPQSLSIIGMKVLKLLLQGDDSPEQLEQPGHPSGIELSEEAQEAISSYCHEHSCTERELFTEHYDPLRPYDCALEIGLEPMLYLSLVNYYRGSIEGPDKNNPT